MAAVLVAVLATGCKDQVCNTPIGQGGSIYLYEPQYASLATVGGRVMVSAGHKGVIIYHASQSVYVAFEATCPKDHESRLESVEGWDWSVVKCPQCGSMFETVYGQPVEGSATGCPLYEYSTVIEGDKLTIY